MKERKKVELTTERKLREFLEEDLGSGDITTDILIPEEVEATSVIRTKEDGVIAGLEEIEALSKLLGLTFTQRAKDGEKVRKGTVLAEITGGARNLLKAERLLLNLLSHMSGIATTTRTAIELAHKENSKVKIAATRKTLPGLRFFEKKAVILGGGDPHRYDLSSMVLIKDNHIKIAGSLETALNRAREKASFTQKIAIEVTSPPEALKAAKAGADIIMFDNMSQTDIRKAVRLVEKNQLRNKVILEASGGITLENVRSYAATEVDVISMGSLTHSSKALDVTMKIA